MNHLASRWLRLKLRFGAALVLLGLLAVAAPSSSEELPSRAKEIADIENQIADLKKKLAELTKDRAPNSLRPLQFSDAAAWRSIRSSALSPDGKWFGYSAGPAEGDTEVVLRATTGDQETKWQAGRGSGVPVFSRDSRWFAFTVSGRGKREGFAKAPTGPPRSGSSKAVLVNIASGDKTEFEGVRRFAFSGEAAAHLALHFSPAEAAPSSTPNPGPTPGPSSPPSPSSTGTDFLLHDLRSGAQLNFGNVADFAFDKKGRWLVLIIDSPGKMGNGVQLYDLTTGVLTPLDTGKAEYRGLTWTEKGEGFTVLKGVEDPRYADKLYSVLGFTAIGPKAKKTVFDPRSDSGFPKEMTISPNRTASWTDDLTSITFGIHALKKKDEKAAPREIVRRDDRAAPRDGRLPEAGGKDKPDLVIWHWADERLQSQQQVQASSDKSFSYLAVFHVKDKKFVRLADDSLRQVSMVPQQRWAIALDSKPYQRRSTLDGRRYQDVYVVDPQTAARRKVLTKNRWYYGPSPDGSHFLYFADGHFRTCELATGKTFTITEGVPTSFVDTEDDHNVDRPPTRFLAWAKDSDAVLLSDGWDLWKVGVHGGQAANLTADGKSEAVRYRGIISFDRDQKGIDLSKPVYLSAHGEWTKKAGFARLAPGKPGAERLRWDDAEFATLMKARDADVFVCTRETFKDCPDYYATDAELKESRRLTRTNTQQEKVAWCSGARLIDYTSAKGEKLQGALFLPANYQTGKSYPTIVYIYERLSDRIHHYSAPSASGFNVSLYTSNGYAVLMPDIKYKINDPGMSAVWCVLPALEAAIATGVVDRERVGLHGHSWGGYQTAFLITQTPAFKAAVAGAPLTDLVSMYSSIYWNSGSANQPIFESSQGRFSSPYWENLDAYIRNSPVHHAKNVKTPLLLLHNDKDGAVDWNQGIEYFNTLRRLEKPVVMLQYKGENHGLVKPANRRDYAERMREFFDHHLLGKPAPAWLKEGVPHLQIEEHLKERGKGKE